jgi:hypothetical protein
VTVPGTDRTQETTALDVFMADTAFPAWVEPAYRGLLERVRSLEAALREAYTAIERAQFDAHDREWARTIPDRIRAVLDVASPAPMAPGADTTARFDPASGITAAQLERIEAATDVASPATLPCGHPFDEAVTADEGTSYCGACAGSAGLPSEGDKGG